MCVCVYVCVYINIYIHTYVYICPILFVSLWRCVVGNAIAPAAFVVFADDLYCRLLCLLPRLQVIEYEEWGNPSKKEFYEYIKSYSPVDNIQKTSYPNILITAGLHDPRVGEIIVPISRSARSKLTVSLLSLNI